MKDGTPSINLDEKVIEKYRKMEMVYMKDQEFYAFYKLTTLLERGKKKDDLVFQLESILPAHGVRSEYYRSIPFALHILREYCSTFKLEIDKIYLPEDKISKGFYRGHLEELQKYHSQKPNVPAIIAEREFVTALIKGTATSKELFKISIPMGHLPGVLDYAIFRIKRPTKKQMQNILGFFWIYIEKFGNNQLHVGHDHEVYYSGLNQLGIFAKNLRKHAEEYAPETIISLSEMLEGDGHLPDGPLKNYSKFMPVHAVALFEKLGWIEVMHMNAGSLDWIESMDMYDTEKNESREINGYRVKLRVLDKFMEFTDPKAIQEEPEKPASAEKWWSENDVPQFDDKSGAITLGERKCMIPLSAVNQIVTCKAVFSKPLDEWTKEIEVIHNFYHGENSERALKDATRAINQKTRESFGFDLLEHEGRARRVRIKNGLFRASKV